MTLLKGDLLCSLIYSCVIFTATMVDASFKHGFGLN